MSSKPTEVNDINELREILFASMRSLKKGASADDIALAKMQSDLAQTIINSVKVEVDFVRATGGQGSGFIKNITPKGIDAPPDEKPAKNPSISHPAPGVTRHLMS